MSSRLPELILKSDFNNDDEAYKKYLQIIYTNEIVNANLTYESMPIRYKFVPKVDNIEFGLHHLLTEGPKIEEERKYVEDRCERLRWIPWVITNSSTNKAILKWSNYRFGNKHHLLWLKSDHFIVVLAERNGYFLLKSAYVTHERREKSLMREYNLYT